MIRGGTHKLKKLNMHGQRYVARVCIGHIQVWPEKENLPEYVIPQTQWKAGNVVLYSKKTGNKFAVDADYVDRFYPKLFSPIGIVVIPQSHNVYGDGTAGVMSLKWMNRYTPNEGSTSGLSMYFGYDPNERIYDTTFDSISNDANYRCYYNNYGDCSGDVQTTVQSSPDYGFYYPSNKFATGQGQIYPNDSRLKYAINKGGANTGYTYTWGISPYKNDDTVNNDFRGYAGSYFNGDKYQNIWLSLIKNEDWKTVATITNSSTQEQCYPPVMCAWRYSTEGTKQGDWYIPSSTELLYILPKYNEIEYALKKINDHFGDVVLTDLATSIGASNYSFFSTTSNNCNPHIILSDGQYHAGYTFGTSCRYLAFTKMKSDIDDRQFHSVEFRFANGIKQIKVMIGSESYVLTSDRIFTDIPKGTYISWEAIIDEDDYECNNAIGEIASLKRDEVIVFDVVEKPIEVTPSKDILYKTTNNQICTWTATGNATIARNYYDSALGYNILSANVDLTENLGFHTSGTNITDLIYFPNSISSLDCVLYRCLDLKNVTIPSLPKVRELDVICDYTFESKDVNDEINVNMQDFVIKKMPRVTTMGNVFNIYRPGNYIAPTSFSLNKFVIGDMPSLNRVDNFMFVFHEGNHNTINLSIGTLDLSGIRNVETIGLNFMYEQNGGIGNRELNVDNFILPPMPNLTTIENNFIRSFFNLKTLDLSASTNLTTIGNNFLTNCTGLTKVILPPSVTSIGTGCFTDSTAITYLETPMLTTNINSTVRGNLTTLVLNGDTVIGNLTSVITSPNAGLKVYVKKTLLANYKSAYSAWQSRFLTIEDDLS